MDVVLKISKCSIGVNKIVVINAGVDFTDIELAKLSTPLELDGSPAAKATTVEIYPGLSSLDAKLSQLCFPIESGKTIEQGLLELVASSTIATTITANATSTEVRQSSGSSLSENIISFGTKENYEMRLNYYQTNERCNSTNSFTNKENEIQQINNKEPGEKIQTFKKYEKLIYLNGF
jgi:hypothetical protein